jgi:hypothetical protein
MPRKDIGPLCQRAALGPGAASLLGFLSGVMRCLGAGGKRMQLVKSCYFSLIAIHFYLAPLKRRVFDQ